MTEEKKAAPKKKAETPEASAPVAAKSPKAKAALKSTEASAPAAKAPAKKEAAPKKEVSGKTITITQTGSSIGRQGRQQATLIGLGLNKRHRSRTLKDTPEVRGMIETVKHLVKVSG